MSDLIWIRSTRCSTATNCVQVTDRDGLVKVGNSKLGDATGEA
jgi:hypothetical protein